MGFFVGGCEPDAPFGVEEAEALTEGGSCLGGRFGGASSTTLNNSRSSSAPRSHSSSGAFLTGDADAEGVVTVAVQRT